MKTDKNLPATQATGGAVAAYDYGQDAGAGFESTSGKDLSVPFLAILQSNSPQVENKDPAGAEAGMIFNTVTRELISGEQGVVFLPVHKELAYVEWVPRKKGGGFVALHDPNSDQVKAILKANGGKLGKLAIGENELVETIYVYGLILDAEGKETKGFGVISFTSTKIKPQKDWFTAMYLLKGKPPLFANRAVIRTIKQKNEHGTFYNFRIDPLKTTWLASLISPEEEGALLSEAREFRDMVMSGMARAAFETQDAASGAGGEGGGSADPDGPAPF